MIFDTHAHYDSEDFDKDRNALLLSLPSHGIGAVCNIGATYEGAENSVALAKQYPFVYAAVGVHPDECGAMEAAWLSGLSEMTKEKKVVAIGEIGLDYHGFGVYPDKVGKETQKYWFQKQLELAIDLKLPVVIHSRNAAEDTLEMMKKAHDAGLKGGIIHCFSYSQEIAKEYVRMGFYIGLGGVVTYEGQKKLTKVLSVTPLSRIVLETDCPYLAPVPHRGERNSSLYLPYVRDRIAALKGISPQEAEQATWENAYLVYEIS